MNSKFLIAAVAVWVAALGLAGFSYLRPDGAAEPRAASDGGGQTAEQTSEQTARQGVSSNVGGASEAGEKMKLRLTGEPGTTFSGLCESGGEERQMSGEAPQSFSFEPGERLECEISSRGPLRISFSDAGGTETSQSTGSGDSTLQLTYDGDSLSSTTRSESRTSASQTSTSQSSSQTSSSQSSSSSITRSGSE